MLKFARAFVDYANELIMLMKVAGSCGKIPCSFFGCQWPSVQIAAFGFTAFALLEPASVESKLDSLVSFFKCQQVNPPSLGPPLSQCPLLCWSLLLGFKIDGK